MFLERDIMHFMDQVSGVTNDGTQYRIIFDDEYKIVFNYEGKTYSISYPYVNDNLMGRKNIYNLAAKLIVQNEIRNLKFEKAKEVYLHG